MRELDPTALRRMFALRKFAMFATTELGDLALLADNIVEVVHPAGTHVATPGTIPDCLHLIVSGTVERLGTELGPHSIVNALEVFARREARTAAIAVSDTRTLAIRRADVHELLEDNFGLMRATLRELAARLVGVTPPRLEAPAPETLGLVERLTLLRELPAFAGGRLESLAALAHATSEVRWTAGTELVYPRQPTSSYLLVDGELHVGERVLRAGDAFLVFELLAESQRQSTANAVTPVRALEMTATALFDVLEDHPDLGMAMIASLSRMLIDAQN